MSGSKACDSVPSFKGKLHCLNRGSFYKYITHLLQAGQPFADFVEMVMNLGSPELILGFPGVKIYPLHLGWKPLWPYVGLRPDGGKKRTNERENLTFDIQGYFESKT